MEQRVSAPSELRLAELMAALSLATDLGMGQPLEQALRTCLIALRIARLANLSAEEMPAVYYGALLRFLGCTADRHETTAVTGDDIAFRRALAPVFGARMSEAMRAVIPAVGRGHGRVARVGRTARFLVRGLPVMREGVRAHCEVGEALATSLGLSDGIHRCLMHAFEAWNGHGFPNGVRGDAIVAAARVVVVSRDLEVLGRTVGRETAPTVIARRGNAGTYDPALADLVGREGVSILAEVEGLPAWEAVNLRGSI
jgi:hypothetical protein